ncbi:MULTISPECIES: VirD4-like conjugal transfer protein, CD1115 family [Lactobacillus]|uniref:VirD4-like conjugal transfer protein, CD1115 family n=1 Tax=Lactobacillus TaxID=1578 RepID=UPI000CD8B903|nr:MULTISPECIES: type IV secretory system conjugative DNA transfer family protein [Lactobacillus]RVU73340.1 conjugal transfer protein [Lactobacillus xujianguonis]
MQQIGFNAQANEEPKESFPWQPEYSSQATIFGKETFIPINFDKALNDNTLVIGTSGTGKTYSFLEPNLLQGNSNYVIADAKGSILTEIGHSLKKMGYQLQVLNLVDLKHSMTFNPLANLRDEADVSAFAQEVLSTNMAGQRSHSNHEDPFWQNAAASMLEAIIFFVKDELPEEEQTMATVNFLFTALNFSPDRINDVLVMLGEEENGYYFDNYVENSDHPKLLGDYLFDWVRENDPESTSIKMWDIVRGMAGSPRTWSSMIGILGSDLAAYNLQDVSRLMSGNQIDFHQLLEPKHALFILYDDANSSKNFISNVLYAQLISFLYRASRKYPKQALPVKIRFFLDDFKNINIPGFEDYLATARSRNMSFCMLLQDESQLEAKFLLGAKSVIGDCSSYLLTGTTDLTMAKIAAERFNLTSQQVRLLDTDHFLLDVGGHLTKPTRYDFHDHPHYVPGVYHIDKIRPKYYDEDRSHLKEILKYLPHVKNVVEDNEEFLTALGD